MTGRTIGCLVGFVSMLMLMACTPTTRTVAHTVNDAARIACEAVFGEAPPPEGISAREICAKYEQLKPFIDAIIGARKAAESGLAVAPDAGADGG